MRYKVVVRRSDDGYSASCPALPSCRSEGTTKQEALERMAGAIRDYLAATDPSRGADLREVDVRSSGVPNRRRP